MFNKNVFLLLEDFSDYNRFPKFQPIIDRLKFWESIIIGKIDDRLHVNEQFSIIIDHRNNTNNYTYPPTATTLQSHPPVYHTTRDTTVLSCQQQPHFNNIHLSTILSEIRLYFPVNSNHLTITPTCLPYYQRHNCTFLSTATTLQ